MHRCPQCGYEPLPTPTHPPSKSKSIFGKWQVMVWTEECHEHRAVYEYNTEAEADAMYDRLRDAYLKTLHPDAEEVLETVAEEAEVQL